MPKRNDVRALKKIVEIREIQRAAAEMRAAEAEAAVRGLQAKREDVRSALAGDQACWLRSVSQHSMELSLVRAWSSRVVGGQGDLTRLDAEVESAQARKARLGEALHLASARAEAARELAKSASEEESRRREEAVLADLADRFAGRRPPP